MGNSTYESLQVTANKRFHNGSSLALAYTHAKLISNTETITTWLESGGSAGIQDHNNLRAEKSVASFDTPDRLIVSYVLDVPVGKGRRYLANSNALVQAAIGGWGVQGTTTLQTGFPLHFGTNSNQTNSQGGGSRPNVVAGCNKSIDGPVQSRLSQYFNTSCFTAPPAFTYGNEGRNDPNLRSPESQNGTSPPSKTFRLRLKARRFQFRAEFFNIFNRVSSVFQTRRKGTRRLDRSPARQIFRDLCNLRCV